MSLFQTSHLQCTFKVGHIYIKSQFFYRIRCASAEFYFGISKGATKTIELIMSVFGHVVLGICS